MTSLNDDKQTATIVGLRELFAEHAPFVWRSLRRLGVSRADLEDALQEVFLVVHRRLVDYEERERSRPWLYSICARVAYAQRRKVERRRENIGIALPERPAPATQLKTLEQREALDLGYRLLELLSAEQREVFVLYEVEQMRMHEIAQAVGCPLQTAYSRLHSARRRVFAALEALRKQGEVA